MADGKVTRVQVSLTETQDKYLNQCVALYDGDKSGFLKALIDALSVDLVNKSRMLLGKPKMTKEDIQEGRSEPKRKR